MKNSKKKKASPNYQHVDYIEQSRVEWGGNVDVNKTDFPGTDFINMASLQRIAKAVERMATGYERLNSEYEGMRRDRDYWKKKAKKKKNK